jgi:hypothetical protein
LIKGYLAASRATLRSALGSGEQLVAQEHRAVGDDGVCGLNAVENLDPVILPNADVDGALGD